MIKYENGKVYKIITNNPNEPCYVGSTAQPYLSNRMADHISSYRTWIKSDKKARKIMSFELFDKYGVENCKIILLESVNAKSKDELRQKEQEFINKLNCVNERRAYCTFEERRKEATIWMNEKYIPFHKEDKAKYDAGYRIKNMEKLKTSRKQKYRCMTCNYELTCNKKSRHDRTKLHSANTIKYMKSLTESYNQVKPIEIQHFSLE